jgi:hypothetical protein
LYDRYVADSRRSADGCNPPIETIAIRSATDRPRPLDPFKMDPFERAEAT